jgi:hypothetical protein
MFRIHDKEGGVVRSKYGSSEIRGKACIPWFRILIDRLFLI